MSPPGTSNLIAEGNANRLALMKEEMQVESQYKKDQLVVSKSNNVQLQKQTAAREQEVEELKKQTAVKQQEVDETKRQNSRLILLKLIQSSNNDAEKEGYEKMIMDSLQL